MDRNDQGSNPNLSTSRNRESGDRSRQDSSSGGNRQGMEDRSMQGSPGQERQDDRSMQGSSGGGRDREGREERGSIQRGSSQESGRMSGSQGGGSRQNDSSTTGVSTERDRAGGYGYDRPADVGGDSGMSASPDRSDKHVQSNFNSTGSNRSSERDRATGTPADERNSQR